jgi:hypothetical protein
MSRPCCLNDGDAREAGTRKTTCLSKNLTLASDHAFKTSRTT